MVLLGSYMAIYLPLSTLGNFEGERGGERESLGERGAEIISRPSCCVDTQWFRRIMYYAGYATLLIRCYRSLDLTTYQAASGSKYRARNGAK